MLFSFLRKIPEILPATFRGRRILLNILRWFCLGKTGRLAKLGNITFPFLSTHWPFYFGTYEPETAHLLQDVLGPGDVFVDVGANVGYFSSLALNQVGGDGKVYGFEPEKGHFDRLAMISTLNPEYKFKAFPYAVGNKDGYATLYISDHPGWHSLQHDFVKKTYIGEKTVPILCLDTFFVDYKLNSSGAVKLLKIDVEGAEDLVFAGAKQVFSQHWAQNVFVEVVPSNFFTVRSTLIREGYGLYHYINELKQWIPFHDESIHVQKNIVAKVTV